MISPGEALIEAARERARGDLLTFLRWCWWMPHPLAIGRHTRAVCERLTRAVDDWRRGVSTYLLVAVPFRHGKSDMVSRALPAWFLGRNADRQPDIIMTGYGASLVQGFSRDVQRILKSEAYQELFPGVYPQTTKKADWQVQGSAGTVTAQGLGGSIVGKGGSLIIVDDYCKNRKESESQSFRDAIWNSFTTDVVTRGAPTHIVIVCATPWHVDDLRGRIIKHMEENPSFARYEELSFPAHKDGPGGWDFLFPERFPPQWYAMQRATLGRIAAAQLDCQPVADGGGRFNTSKVQFCATMEGWPAFREARAWDLASSAKERDKDDPDRTWGVRGGITRTRRRIEGSAEAVETFDIWITSMGSIRAEAPARDAFIRETARRDGHGVAQIVEAFGGYKDAYTTLKHALAGVSTVRKSRLPGDKSAKLADLEPCFEAGRVHVYTGGCSKEDLALWRSEFDAFPAGAHDDSCDATAILYHSFADPGSFVI